MAECRHCLQAAMVRHWAGYAMGCVQCCARLVRNARPNKPAQEGHLHCITRRQGRPTKADILAAIAQQDAQARMR